MSRGIVRSYVPYPMVCIECGGKAIMYPSSMGETGDPVLRFGTVACEHCSPSRLGSFLLFRLERDRERAGLPVLTQADLPEGIVLEGTYTTQGTGT